MASANGQARPNADGASLIDSILAGQARAVACLASQRTALAAAARLVAVALRGGGRILYLGAGSSGLLAAQDGLELPGTFGLDPGRIRFITPNGDRFALDGAAEDDERAGEAGAAALAPARRDVAIALSASGATPFTLAAARKLHAAGVPLVAVVCRAASPLAAIADASIVLDVGAEAVEGSTRLAAGTAQKAALGALSTLAAAELGWVHDGQMVNLKADNAKLKARAEDIVARIASVGRASAAVALAQAQNDVPVAIAAVVGDLNAAEARSLVADCDRHIARILARLRSVAVKSHTNAGEKPVQSGG